MPNILICDDEKDIVSALKIYLSDPDYILHLLHPQSQDLDETSLILLQN